jgi:hypothetical protein
MGWRRSGIMAVGDHIKVRRLGGLYTHHGIDLGDGDVVHLSGEPLHRKSARVCRVTMEAFLKGEKALVVRHRGKVRDPEDVVATALEHLGEAGYDVWNNNCEHFAWFCKTGHKKSPQVKRALKTAASVAAAGIVVATAVGVKIMKARRRGRA